jgi:hypothetical protein
VGAQIVGRYRDDFGVLQLAHAFQEATRHGERSPPLAGWSGPASRFREHRREDLITKLAPVEYDPEAVASVWETFLERTLPSEALRRFLQRAVGYSLSGDVGEQILLFLYGTGALQVVIGG